MAYSYVHDPNETSRVGFDWAEDGFLEGATINSSTWTGSPELTRTNPSNQSGVTLVSFTGGALGGKYYLTNKVVLSDGREPERTITVRVADK